MQEVMYSSYGTTVQQSRYKSYGIRPCSVRGRKSRRPCSLNGKRFGAGDRCLVALYHCTTYDISTCPPSTVHGVYLFEVKAARRQGDWKKAYARECGLRQVLVWGLEKA